MIIRNIEVTFPGGQRVDALMDGRVIGTDQRPESGGEGSAPEPFELFLASLATCAGIFALRFCQARELSTEGLALTMACEKDPEMKLYRKMTLNLTLPEGFPPDHEAAIRRAVDLCTVKRHMVDPPEFEIVTS